MRVVTDCFGHRARLTDERLAHILEHPELKEMQAEIEQVLSAAATGATLAHGCSRAALLRLLCADAGRWQVAVRCGEI